MPRTVVLLSAGLLLAGCDRDADSPRHPPRLHPAPSPARSPRPALTNRGDDWTRVAVAPDNRTIFVANGHGDSVAFIDADSLKVVATVPTGRRPWGIAVTPDGRKLHTANGLSGDVTVIDVVSRKPIGTVKTGEGAWGVVIVR